MAYVIDLVTNAQIETFVFTASERVFPPPLKMFES